MQFIDSASESMKMLEFEKTKLILNAIEKSVHEAPLKLQYEFIRLDFEVNFRLKNFSQCYEILINAEKNSKLKGDQSIQNKLLIQFAVLYSEIGVKNRFNEYINRSILSMVEHNYQDTSSWYQLLNLIYAVNDTNLMKRIRPHATSAIDGLQFVYNNTSNNPSYLKLNLVAGFNLALFQLNNHPYKALKLFREIEQKARITNNPSTLGNAISCIGELYMNMKLYDRAEEKIKESIQICYKIRDYEVLHKNYSLLIAIGEKTNRKNKLIEYYVKKSEFRDSIWKRSLHYKEFIEMHHSLIQSKETEKKHLQSITEQIRKQNKLRGQYITLLIICSCVLILMLFFVKYNYNKKKKILDFEKAMQQLSFQNQITLAENTHILKESQAMATGYLAAQKFIAMELHDKVANTIASIKMKLDNLSKLSQDNDNLAKIVHLLDILYHKVRSLSITLSITQESTGSLELLLSEFISDYRISNEIEVVWEVKLSNEPSEFLKSEIYTILVELLMNIYKHSNSKFSELNIFELENNYCIELYDYGIDFEFQYNDSYGGLNNIIRRLQKIHGTMNRNFSRDKGNFFYIKIPIK
ncbi:MAG: hypothetical protein JNM44_00585 [Chitinophagaceae bacterium]|nr:hypothetical protein [Chitinophagaceae bacterium]